MEFGVFEIQQEVDIGISARGWSCLVFFELYSSIFFFFLFVLKSNWIKP